MLKANNITESQAKPAVMAAGARWRRKLRLVGSLESDEMGSPDHGHVYILMQEFPSPPHTSVFLDPGELHPEADRTTQVPGIQCLHPGFSYL